MGRFGVSGESIGHRVSVVVLWVGIERFSSDGNLGDMGYGWGVIHSWSGMICWCGIDWSVRDLESGLGVVSGGRGVGRSSNKAGACAANNGEDRDDLEGNDKLLKPQRN